MPRVAWAREICTVRRWRKYGGARKEEGKEGVKEERGVVEVEEEDKAGRRRCWFPARLPSSMLGSRTEGALDDDASPEPISRAPWYRHPHGAGLRDAMRKRQRTRAAAGIENKASAAERGASASRRAHWISRWKRRTGLGVRQRVGVKGWELDGASGKPGGAWNAVRSRLIGVLGGRRRQRGDRRRGRRDDDGRREGGDEWKRVQQKEGAARVSSIISKKRIDYYFKSSNPRSSKVTVKYRVSEMAVGSSNNTAKADKN
ncbi:hypothetical protein B0H19DRAFT_1084954 [Mycena capillaripes]|nr:hypothetical protein B0H19DRAFT_1084954 [Mycena capillaripes]